MVCTKKTKGVKTARIAAVVCVTHATTTLMTAMFLLRLSVTLSAARVTLFCSVEQLTCAFPTSDYYGDLNSILKEMSFEFQFFLLHKPSSYIMFKWKYNLILIKYLNEWKHREKLLDLSSSGRSNFLPVQHFLPSLTLFKHASVVFELQYIEMYYFHGGHL